MERTVPEAQLSVSRLRIRGGWGRVSLSEAGRRGCGWAWETRPEGSQWPRQRWRKIGSMCGVRGRAGVVQCA